MEEKRKRTLNFTSDEKAVLTELVIKYKDILENRKTDATANVEKTNCWKRLAEEFNTLSTHCRRYPESLKTCWENIKRQTKKQAASQKKEIFKTGGGRPPPPPPNTGTSLQIEAILGPALEGIENPYDSDALILNDEEKNTTQSATVNDYSQIGSDTELHNSEYDVLHSIEVDEDPLIQNPIAGSSTQNCDESVNANWNKENKLKWEGWTPNSLKRPISEVLKTSPSTKKNSSWLKRRRPDHKNLNDQLIQEKINLVKKLIYNAEEESKRRILILEEQLKQEKLKTKALL